MITQQQKAGTKEWIGLAIIALPCMLYAMDLTVLNLALPTITREFQPSATELLWIVDIYGFMVAGLLITMGNIGDRIGRRKLLMAGAATFGLASAVAAFSSSAPLLILNRAILGIAGATIAPSTLSLIRNMFHDERQRTFAIGIWITSYSVGGAIGPLVGGVLLQYFSWPSVFLANVPVMVLLLILAPRFLPEYKDPGATRIDVLSVILSIAAVLLTIYGFKTIADEGWHVGPVATITVGLLLGYLFFRRQQQLRDPLIDVRLFRGSSTFTWLLVFNILTVFTMFGSFVFIGQYLQLVLGYSPLNAGLWTLPWSLGFVVGSLFTPKLIQVVSRSKLLIIGLLFSAASFFVLARIESMGLYAIVISSVLLSLGSAPMFTLVTDLILGSVPPERAGTAGALSETSFEFGGALGIAILGSIGVALYQSNLGALPATLGSAAVKTIQSTLGGAISTAQGLPASLRTQVTQAAQQAFVHSLVIIALLSAVLSLLLAIIARWKLKV